MPHLNISSSCKLYQPHLCLELRCHNAEAPLSFLSQRVTLSVTCKKFTEAWFIADRRDLNYSLAI